MTISGFWYSSPIFFQKATLAKIDWYFSRSFSLRIFALDGALRRLGRGAAPSGAGGSGSLGRRDAGRRRTPVAAAVGDRCVGALSRVGLGLVGGHLGERQDVGLDHAQRRTSSGAGCGAAARSRGWRRHRRCRR